MSIPALYCISNVRRGAGENASQGQYCNSEGAFNRQECPFVNDHKWIKSNGGVSWEEGGQLGRSLCGQSDRKVTLFPLTMNDEARNKQSTFEGNVTIYAWTT